MMATEPGRELEIVELDFQDVIVKDGKFSAKLLHSKREPWAGTYRVSLTGDATLSYRTSTGHRLLMIGQLLTWVFAAMALLRVSGRAREVRS